MDIVTFTGHRIDLSDPDRWLNAWDEVDIAHALSHLCRFGGHVRGFLSVAQHSLNVARRCAPEYRLYALLHDAAEAYILDIPRPLKSSLVFRSAQGDKTYRKLEDEILQAILWHFGLTMPIPNAVKRADDQEAQLECYHYATQNRDILPAGYVPDREESELWAPDRAKREFLRALGNFWGEDIAKLSPSLAGVDLEAARARLAGVKRDGVSGARSSWCSW